MVCVMKNERKFGIKCCCLLLIFTACAPSPETETQRCFAAREQVEAMEAVKMDVEVEMEAAEERANGKREIWHIDADNWLEISESGGQKTWMLQKDGRQYLRSVEGAKETFPWQEMTYSMPRERRVAFEWEEEAEFVRSEKEDGLTKLSFEVPKERLLEAWEAKKEESLSDADDEMREDMMERSSRPTAMEYSCYLDEEGNLEKTSGVMKMEQPLTGEESVEMTVAETAFFTEISREEGRQKLEEVFEEAKSAIGKAAGQK